MQSNRRGSLRKSNSVFPIDLLQVTENRLTDMEIWNDDVTL